MGHPLDKPEIESTWQWAAGTLGFTVVRTREAYATSDGRGRIAIGAHETLDDDDSYAQLVFHELCHAVVQGEENLGRPDWGLDNTSDDDLDDEHGCLRVQAHLAQRFGLRPLLAPTTVVRDYYLKLPGDALAGDDAGAGIARQAVATALFRRWLPTLEEALARTAALASRPAPASGTDRGR